MNADDELAIALAAACRRCHAEQRAREDAARAELPRTFTAARKEQGQLLRRLWRLIIRLAA